MSLMLAAVLLQSSLLGRFKEFTQSQNLTAKFEVTSKVFVGKGTGELSIAHPLRQRFKLAWGSGNYEFRQDRTGGIELEQSRHAYLLLPKVLKLLPPPGEVSPLPFYGYPYPLLGGNLQAEYAELAQYFMPGERQGLKALGQE